MQIHELNNFSGTLGSGAYLAIDDGNDTGKISSQGLLAATEARIDNIIAGPAPSAEEIVDARLGDDGVTYPSLGDAIRDQFSDVKSDLNYMLDASVNFDSLIENAYQGGTTYNAAGYEFINMSLTTASNRIRTLNDKSTVKNGILFPANTELKIEVDDGYKYAYQVYNLTTGVALDTYQFHTETTIIKKSVPVSFILTLGKTNDANISPSEMSHVTLNVSNDVKNEIVTKVDFSHSQTLTPEQKETARENIGATGDGFDKVTLPFSSNLGVDIYKSKDGYYADFVPQSKAITDSSGVAVFVAPNGSDSNSGLTVNDPKGTIESAVNVSNVATIILLSGTYEADANFTAGATITKDLNLIGVGDVKIDSKTGAPITFTGNLYCDNIEFVGGNNAVIYQPTAETNVACFFRCKFTNSYRNNGLAVKGGKIYLVDCIAFDNAYDGFNYHANDSIAAESIEINCKSYNNGHYNLAGADGQSSNATTSHDNCSIIRVNGDYCACHGGIVADKDCSSANYGCRAGVSTVTDYANYPDRMSNYWSSGASMYLYDCISYGSKYDTAKIRSGTITSNVTYNSNYSA